MKLSKNKINGLSFNKKSKNCEKNQFSINKIVAAMAVVTLTACGGGGGTDDYSPPASSAESTSQSLNGAGVKGPMINAQVSVYKLNINAQNLRGELVAEGSTNAQAAIEGVKFTDALASESDFLDQLFLVEVSGGTVLGTGQAPVINTQKTIVTGYQYSRDFPVYATPLTTLAIELAHDFIKRNPSISFSDALNGSGVEINNVPVASAQSKVVKAFGLGLIDNFNIFTTAPILTAKGNPERALNYRIALETFAAVVVNIQQASGGTDTNTIINLVAADLSDGVVDGVNADGPVTALSTIPTLSQLVTADPATLNIPNTQRPISDLANILTSEASVVAEGIEPPVGLVTPPLKSPLGGIKDSDQDGVADGIDVFPLNPNEWLDTDGDCGQINDEDQTISSGSGCGDNSDWAPDDPAVTSACDNGARDKQTGALLTNQQKIQLGCVDTDNDGILDINDLFPLNINEWADSDGDCPASETDPNLQTEFSGAECGDNADVDICYDVFIEGNILLPANDAAGADATTAHGVGKAKLDSYTGVLEINAVQRAQVKDPFANYKDLADGIVRTDYIIDTNDYSSDTNLKYQRDCVDLVADLVSQGVEGVVDACGVLEGAEESLRTYERWTPVDIVDDYDCLIFNCGGVVDTYDDTYRLAGDKSTIRFTSKFELIAQVVSRHYLEKTSEVQGGSCNLNDLPQSAATSIPQSYRLP